MGNKIALPKVPQLRKKREPEAAPAEGGDDPDYWRQEARQHAERRNEFFERSQAAYRQNKGGEAKTLSDQGKEEERLMQQANQRASDTHFKRNNASVEPDFVDLHGLYVREAEAIMEKQIARARREKRDHLVAIVGQGHHNARYRALCCKNGGDT
ncbi:hypothetical protein WJX73_008935 [Symbiochloris irregularis]|uniref:Smr domain-containing protein n=1 Tax=Symbiochloris irregularis TaxID=706552 RepID=A0AAW1PLG4_9CHLO